MKAPTIFAGVIPLVMCCRLMLNLRDRCDKLSTTITTQGAEFPGWSYHFREPPLEREMDSMGLPRFTGKRLVVPQIPITHLFFVGITIDDSAE